MAGEVQPTDSVKVNLPEQRILKKDGGKELIEINFRSEDAEKVSNSGLLFTGLGIEIAERTGKYIQENARENVHESAEKIREYQEKHPVLSKFTGTLVQKIILCMDKFMND